MLVATCSHIANNVHISCARTPRLGERGGGVRRLHRQYACRVELAIRMGLKRKSIWPTYGWRTRTTTCKQLVGIRGTPCSKCYVACGACNGDIADKCEHAPKLLERLLCGHELGSTRTHWTPQGGVLVNCCRVLLPGRALTNIVCAHTCIASCECPCVTTFTCFHSSVG